MRKFLFAVVMGILAYLFASGVQEARRVGKLDRKVLEQKVRDGVMTVNQFREAIRGS